MNFNLKNFILDQYNLADGENLTPSPARKRNKEIIAYALEQLKSLQEEAKKEGINADFDLVSLSEFLLFLTHKCSLVSYQRRELASQYDINYFPNENWDEIRFKIDPDSYRYIVMGGIYWGETLIRNTDFLYWDLGVLRQREKNFPWIYGYKKGILTDYNPITVFSNISLHILEKKDTDDRLRNAIKNEHERILNNPDYSKRAERLKRLF